MIGEWLEGDDAPMLCIDPDWGDVAIAAEWNSAGYCDNVPAGTTFDRDTLYRYSARQMRECQPGHDTYWAEDGELKTFVVVATPRRGYPQATEATP